MSNYINLKINGRLFPSWLLLNFKKYKLPKELQGDDEDLCLKKTKNELRKYQVFITKYMDFQGPYKSILLYHGMGSGKTTTAINIYNMLYNYSPDWNMFILLPASLHDTWDNQLLNHPIGLGLYKDEIKNRYKNIKFIHYDSPYAHKKFLEAIKLSDNSKKNVFIIDEVHNFINNVYNNITLKTGQRAYIIYDHIIKTKKYNDDVRTILLTGTPAINNPFELVLLFNLLRPGIFPSSETKFYEEYITNNKLRLDKINMFQRRIMSLVSYYGAKSVKLYAKKVFHEEELEMTKYHEKIYNHFEFIENQLEKKKSSNKGSKIPSTYKAFTRSACNFVFPAITDNITGQNRPRPRDFKISEKEIDKIVEKKETKKDIVEYNNVIELYIKEFRKFLYNIYLKDKKQNKNIQDDVKIFKNKYNGNFKKFWKEHKSKCELLQSLYKYSVKMTAMVLNSFLSKGPLIFFSNYVKMEGLEILKIYLQFFKFRQYGDNKSENYFRYIEYTGSINFKLREKNRNTFNNIKNINGKIIKIILISPAGSEGISLLNVRQVHILEPYWNNIRNDQLIARAVRQCSHKYLPLEERVVDIYQYYSIKKSGKPTTDINIRDLAIRKNTLINSFLKPIKQVAIDCELNREHNIDGAEEYTCFKFNEDILFNKNVGPAYKKNIDYDKNIDNGLNSMNSKEITIDVRQVYAIKKISEDSYSEILKYWLNEKTNIVYDHELEFPIGKISIDEDGIPEFYKKDVYIISKIIRIPQLKLR